MPTPDANAERLLRARIARRLVVLASAGALRPRGSSLLACARLGSAAYLRFLDDLVRSGIALDLLFRVILPRALPDPGRLFRRREFLARNGPTGKVHWPLTIKHHLRSGPGSALEAVCISGSRVLEAPENVLLMATLLEAIDRAGAATNRPDGDGVISRDDRRMLAQLRLNAGTALAQRFLASLTPMARAVRGRGRRAIEALEAEVAGRIKPPRATAPPWARDLLRLRRSLRGLASDSHSEEVPLGPLYALICGLDTLAILRDEIDLRESSEPLPLLVRTTGEPRVEIIDVGPPRDRPAQGLCWLVHRAQTKTLTGVQALLAPSAADLKREVLDRSWDVRYEDREVNRWVILHTLPLGQVAPIRSRNGITFEFVRAPLDTDIPAEAQAALRGLAAASPLPATPVRA